MEVQRHTFLTDWMLLREISVNNLESGCSTHSLSLD